MMSPDRGGLSSNKMKRNTIYLLGALTFLSWLLVTYHLFLQKPNSQNSKLAAEQAERNRQLSAKVDTLDSQLKEQLKSNSLLLSKLVKIRGEGRDDVKVQAVLDLLDDPGLEVADVLRREKILLDNLKESKPSSPVENVLPRKESSLHKEVVGGVFERQPVHPEEDPAIDQQ